LGGVADMRRQPAAIFTIDLRKEQLAVREARRLGLPVIALVDTNCDPDEADYVIPGNDDAIRSCSLIVKAVADGIEAGKQKVTAAEVSAPRVAPKEEAAAAPAPEPEPEAAPEPEPAPEPEAAPEPAAEAVPEPAAEAVPEPAAEAVPEPAAEAPSEPAAEAVPEPAAEAAPQPEPEAAPEED